MAGNYAVIESGIVKTSIVTEKQFMNMMVLNLSNILKLILPKPGMFYNKADRALHDDKRIF